MNLFFSAPVCSIDQIRAICEKRDENWTQKEAPHPVREAERQLFCIGVGGFVRKKRQSDECEADGQKCKIVKASAQT